MSPDLRLPALAVIAWLGGLWAVLVPQAWWAAPVGAVVVVVLLALVRAHAAPRGRTVPAPLLRWWWAGVAVLVAVSAVAAVRASAVDVDPVAQLAHRWTAATLVASVAGDPLTISGAFSRSVVVTVRVREVQAGAVQARGRATARVWAPEEWADLRLGETIRFSGRLQPDPDRQVSAIVRVTDRAPPQQVAAPDVWWQAAEAVRASIRASVEGRPAEQAALLPALVDGDTTAITSSLAEDFRATGLTHLLAVSGTNLTLVVGALMWAARWCRVRGRWLVLVGAVGIVGFVLLARTEPSVVRAAAMGTVGLIAMGSNGRHRGVRALALAVLGLVMFDPSMSVSLGFALSVLATAGILLIAPLWRDSLAQWMPRWAAEAVAVPTAAQLACTPLIAAISGQVSVVAVATNLMAEPAVGPATVLGLLGGLVGLIWPWAGSCCGWLASWCVGWIILLAHRGAALPGADFGSGSGAAVLVGLTLATLVVAIWAPIVLRRRCVGVAVAIAAVIVVAVRLPAGPWPPPGWVLVMCDVGQGDGVVLRAGEHSAVVVDAGPDPGPMRQCLDDVGVQTVPLAVFTHYDSDHVGGVEAVFAGRRVGQVWTTVIDEPAYGRRLVQEAVAGAGLVPLAAHQGMSVSVGEVRLQVLWPPPTLSAGTESNGSSVVLLAEISGIRVLLAGDIDPAGSTRIHGLVPGLEVDVLKVPHHGSRFQDEEWLSSVQAKLALTSVGAGNTYGHPAAATLDPLRRSGTRILRTDVDGAIAVLATGDGVGWQSQR